MIVNNCLNSLLLVAFIYVAAWGKTLVFYAGFGVFFLRKIGDIANPFCDGWFRAGGSKEKIQGTYFEICQTYFKIGQTYFLPSENYFENCPGMRTKYRQPAGRCWRALVGGRKTVCLHVGKSVDIGSLGVCCLEMRRRFAGKCAWLSCRFTVLPIRGTKKSARAP